MELPIIDLEPYLRRRSAIHKDDDRNSGNGENGSDDVGEMCRRVSSSLRDVGALVVRDPRCDVEDNEKFLDMVEKFFQMSDEFKKEQERPLLLYQVLFSPPPLRF